MFGGKEERLKKLLQKAAEGKLSKSEHKELRELLNWKYGKRRSGTFSLEEMMFYDALFGD
ncbi:MAG: hypothetical protein IJU78_08560 [Clostridia bacterium]|nr:hypothetical protein [Clostridia bacterium]